jgi:hypothetical protein
MRTGAILEKSFAIFGMLALFLLVSCGGGGGGGGGKDTTTTNSTTLSYTGSTSKAVIDETNAADISTSAVNGGTNNTAFNGLAALTGTSGDVEVKRIGVWGSANIMQNAVSDILAVTPSASASEKAVQTEQETIDGTCGGQASGTVQVDDVTGKFSGNLNFSNYCESGTSVNGVTNFSGTINTATDEFVKLTLNFDYLNVDCQNGSSVLDGSISISVQSNGANMTMNLYLQDSQSGDIFWLENYNMQIDDESSYMSISISGNFYAPQDGYVSLSTQQNLIIYSGDTNPSSGILVAVGENGPAGGPTLAKLTCLSPDLFQVEADTDGDGIYDWDSGSLSWSDY